MYTAIKVQLRHRTQHCIDNDNKSFVLSNLFTN